MALNRTNSLVPIEFFNPQISWLQRPDQPQNEQLARPLENYLRARARANLANPVRDPIQQRTPASLANLGTQ